MNGKVTRYVSYLSLKSKPPQNILKQWPFIILHESRLVGSSAELGLAELISTGLAHALWSAGGHNDNS